MTVRRRGESCRRPSSGAASAWERVASTERTFRAEIETLQARAEEAEKVVAVELEEELRQAAIRTAALEERANAAEERTAAAEARAVTAESDLEAARREADDATRAARGEMEAAKAESESRLASETAEQVNHAWEKAKEAERVWRQKAGELDAALLG